MTDALNGLVKGLYGIPCFEAPKCLTGRIRNGTLGDNTIQVNGTNYTPPSGRRAMIFSDVLFANLSGSAATVFAKFTRGANTYTISDTQSVSSSNAMVSFSRQRVLPVMSNGDYLIFNYATSSCNAWVSIIEFDDSCFIKGAFAELSNGINTLYTVPSGKQASVFNNRDMTPFRGAMFGYNTEAARQVIPYFQKNGSSINCSTSISNSVVGVWGSGAGFQMPAPLMNPGDTIKISTNATTAQAWAWFTYLEFPTQ